MITDQYSLHCTFSFKICNLLDQLPVLYISNTPTAHVGLQYNVGTYASMPLGVYMRNMAAIRLKHADAKDLDWRQYEQHPMLNAQVCFSALCMHPPRHNACHVDMCMAS